jgi:hypothetical protein
LLGAHDFKEIEKTLNITETTWREFWTIQICLACHLSWPTQPPQTDSRLEDVFSQNLDSELAIIDYINILLARPQIGILSKDWLNRFDQATTTNNTILLFDGLDTGFGNEDADRLRRTNAIQGLLSLITDISDNLKKLKFKVLLREDIWRQLRFDNKSHFFGRSITLNWAKKPDFLKVVIKQALLSSAFKDIVALTNYGKLLLSSNNEDDWIDIQVFEVWNLLVGERMQGAASAFTRNWVWNRLADGTDNRNPRSLLQLFKTATAIEKQEQQKNPYWKTIIRPRSLSSSLDEVSIEALSALNEEFPELAGLIDLLKTLGRSPVNASELQEFDQQLSLAKEVGLLTIYEGTEEEVQRYKVPDLYLKGIGMTRKGQG